MPRQKIPKASIRESLKQAGFSANPLPMTEGDLAADVEARKFVVLADLCTEFIGMYDMELRPVYVNEAGLREVGLDSLEQARSVRIPDFFFPEDQPFLLNEFFSKVLRDGKARVEVRFRHFKTGAALWMIYNVFLLKEPDGKTTGFATFSQNITERKRVEQTLAEQKRLLELSTDAILVRDRSDRITYWNGGAVELYGYTREEALGCAVHELLRTEFPEPLERIRKHLLREDRWTGELIQKRKDGRQIVVVSRWTLDRDTHGNPQSVLVTSNDITQRKQAEEAVRESEERLRRLSETLEAQVQSRTNELEQRSAEILRQSEQLRELWNRLLRTQDEERRQIARELHDSVGQYLAALSMVLGDAMKNPAAANSKLQEAAHITNTCITEIRTISYLLHPPLLEELGLASAVKWYVSGFGERSGIRANVEIAESLGRLGRDVELVLFRVLQESLTNVHRHSGSKTVAIRIDSDSQHVWLEIQDQGKGVANGSVRPGVGITGMRERVKSLNGELEVTSNRSGVRVRVVLPLAATTSKESLQASSATG